MRSIVIVGLALALGFAGIAALAFRHRRQAWTLLENVKQLDASTDQSSAVRVFREKHKDELVYNECSNDLCRSEFLVANWPLSQLRLSPRAELRVEISTYRQKLNSVGIGYTSEVAKRDSAIVHVQEDFCSDRTDIVCDYFALNPHGRNVSPAWNGIIEFGQSATLPRKQAAWGLNLECMVSFRGCKNISQLSPRLWAAAGPALVSSCVRSSADSVAEASQPLPDACPEQ